MLNLLQSLAAPRWPLPATCYVTRIRRRLVTGDYDL